MMAPGHAGPDGALNMVKRVPVQIEHDVEQATTTGLSAQLSSSSQSSVIGSFEQIYGIEQRPARSLRRSREADRVPTSRIDQIALPGELKRSEACRAGPSGPPAWPVLRDAAGRDPRYFHGELSQVLRLACHP